MNLPDFQQILDKIDRSEKLNPLEAFIFENEPALDEFAAMFRQELTALINFVKEQP
jgi:hypothetical protein